MAVRLYNSYIDYNGNRTFINVRNCHGAVYGRTNGDYFGEYQCVAYNCAGLGDEDETVAIGGYGFRTFDCNCL